MTKQENIIYQLLRHWRNLQAEICTVRLCKAPTEQKDNWQTFCLTDMALQIEGWMSQLSDDERFVLKRHLIEGVCWDRVFNDYRKHRYGMKSKATLRRIQANAITKLANAAQNGMCLRISMKQS